MKYTWNVDVYAIRTITAAVQNLLFGAGDHKSTVRGEMGERCDKERVCVCMVCV